MISDKEKEDIDVSILNLFKNKEFDLVNKWIVDMNLCNQKGEVFFLNGNTPEQLLAWNITDDEGKSAYGGFIANAINKANEATKTGEITNIQLEKWGVFINAVIDIKNTQLSSNLSPMWKVMLEKPTSKSGEPVAGCFCLRMSAPVYS